MGLDFDKLFPNRFLKAGEFDGKDVTLKIAGIIQEELEGSKGKQVKAILSFERTPKQLVLNKTNGLCLKGMWGRDTGNWIGKRVTFYPAAIQFEDNDLAIRVRGSPDIDRDMQIEIKLARKKPKAVTMVKTGTKAAASAPPPRAPVEPPPPDDGDAPPDDGITFPE
jgi:hypothetical protein